MTTYIEKIDNEAADTIRYIDIEASLMPTKFHFGLVNSKQTNMAAVTRFRGALVGALIGDCLGAYFEGDMVVPMKDALQQFNAVKNFQRKKEGNGGVGRRQVQP